MDKLLIYKSPSSDSRTAKGPVSKEELFHSSEMHISDVRQGMDFFACMMQEAGKKHDHTKLEFIDAFHKQFEEAFKTGTWPKGPEWWYEKYHLQERHHLEDRVPEDVNLIDVFEMLVDCCMAGMARNGEYRVENEPSPELLKKAFDNTRDLLLSKIEVQDPPVITGSKFGLKKDVTTNEPTEETGASGN